MGLLSSFKSGNAGDTHGHTHRGAHDAKQAAAGATSTSTARDTSGAVLPGGSAEGGAQNRQFSGQEGGRVVEQCTAQNAPILQEHTRNIREEVIQPVVDREIDQTHVQQVMQPIQDNKDETSHHHGIAPGMARYATEDVSTEDARRYQQNRDLYEGRQTSENVDSGATINAPVIREKVNKHVVEEIQPVIDRHIDHHDVHHTVQPIYEHVTAAPIVNDVTQRAPISLEEFESRGGSMSGKGLACDRN